MSFERLKRLYESITPINERQYGISRDIRPTDGRGNKGVRVTKVSNDEYSFVTNWMLPDPTYPDTVNKELLRGVSFYRDGTIVVRLPAFVPHGTTSSQVVRSARIGADYRSKMSRYLPSEMYVTLTKGFTALHVGKENFLFPKTGGLKLKHDGTSWRVLNPVFQPEYRVRTKDLLQLEQEKLGEFYKYADAMYSLVDANNMASYSKAACGYGWVSAEQAKRLASDKSVWLDTVRFEKYMAANERSYYYNRYAMLFNGRREMYRKAIARAYKDKFKVGTKPYGVLTTKHWLERD